MDIRAWDKWGKAFGDFATNKVIQGKFLYDTYKSEYNTPLKKVTRTLASIGGPTVGKGGMVLSGLESLQRESEKAKEMRSAIASGKVQARDPWLELKDMSQEKFRLSVNGRKINYSAILSLLRRQRKKLNRLRFMTS